MLDVVGLATSGAVDEKPQNELLADGLHFVGGACVGGGAVFGEVMAKVSEAPYWLWGHDDRSRLFGRTAGGSVSGRLLVCSRRFIGLSLIHNQRPPNQVKT